MQLCIQNYFLWYYDSQFVNFDNTNIPINKYNFVNLSNILDDNFRPYLLAGNMIFDLYQNIIYILTKSHA